MLTALRVLARLKGLRGTAFDPFGRTEERRTERRLIEEFKQTMDGVLPVLNRDNLELVTSIAALPDIIRGYGHVKDESLGKYQQELARLLGSFDSVALAKTA